MRGVGVGAILCVLLSGGGGLWGQETTGQATAGEGEPAKAAVAEEHTGVPTLHVYANTIQIPTLVLHKDEERIEKPIAPGKFSISLDGGPWFRATHVRQEGDDPISLAILMDVDGSAAELMPRMDTALAALVPGSLTAKDHVSVYAMDCHLVRSLDDAPANGLQLKTAVNTALEAWRERKKDKRGSRCVPTVHLWDALTYMAGQLDRVPGRRVILVLTDGEDKGSKKTWNETKDVAQLAGVTIFAMIYAPVHAADKYALAPTREPKLSMVCELTGGLVFSSDWDTVQARLKGFVRMVRERYIVEFPRPAKSTAGQHDLVVRVEKADYFIRPGGTTTSLPDAAQMADPNTVPSDPTKTPELGTRRILPPK